MRWIAEDGRVTVDDVPVFWHEGPPPFRAGLVFGVGRRDESFVRGGTTHLVEHLTMRALGRTTLDCNASVDVLVTEFVAAGRPERVVGFLRRVCEILEDLPTEGLRIEVDVLSAEDGRVTQPVFGLLLGEAYGGYGAGLAAYREPALRAVTAGEIHAWADRYFTRANAALWLTGPVPDGLTLPPPDGESPARSAQRRRTLSTPAWSQHPFGGHIGIGAHLPRAAGLHAACRILRDRVEDNLRHTRGLSYSVDIDDIPIDLGNRFAAVLADVREGQEATAARALWNELDALAATGPTEAELNHDREGFSEFLIDPRSVGEEVRAAASAHVTSLPFHSLEQQRSEAETVTPEDIRAAAAAFRANAILSVPEPVELSLPGVVRLAEWSPDVVSGRTFRRRIWSGAPRGARLVLGDDGISALLGGAQQITVRYSDVIGLVEIGPDEYELLSGEGFSIPLSRRDWGGGADVIAAVRAAVPADLQVRGDPQDAEGIEGTTVLLLRAPGHVAREAVWPTKRDAWVLPGHQWSLVVFAGDHGKHPYEDAGEVSAWLGRRRAVLVLSQTHDELSYVLMRGGKARSRHAWPVSTTALPGWVSDDSELDPGAATALATALGRSEATEELAALFALRAQPSAVLDEMVRVLDIPPQIQPLLAGEQLTAVPGLEYVPARGFAAGMRASWRGEFDAPDEGVQGQRPLAWHRHRPGGYRLINGLLVLPQAALAWWFARRADGDWTSWWALLTAVAGLGAVSSLWDTRPAPKGPRRNKFGGLWRVAGSHRVVPVGVEVVAGDR